MNAMLWIIVFVLLALTAVEGYYVGAIRACFGFMALVLASLLAMPLAPLAKPILSLFNVTHPVPVAILGPIVVWIIVVILVRSSAETVCYKVNYFYKYKVTEELRLVWEQLNQRLGLCVGVMNGAMYFFALSVLVATLGYASVQVASSEEDPATMRVINRLAEELKQSGMLKAIAPLVPTSGFYCDAADIVGTVYQNPRVQTRLATYPPFLSLMERTEYKALSTNKNFQSFWLKHPPIREVLSHENVKPLITSIEEYNAVLNLLGGDLKDLKQYLETGQSAKYDDIRILGHWQFHAGRSYKLARRQNLNMNPLERLLLRRRLETTMSNAVLTAFVDSQVLLRVTTTNNTEKVIQGNWKEGTGHNYVLTLNDGGRRERADAEVEPGRMTVTKGNLPFVFVR